MKSSLLDAINPSRTSYDRACDQSDRDYTRSHECPEEWPRSGLMVALENMRVPLTREEQDAKNASLNALFSSFDEEFKRDAEEYTAKYPPIFSKSKDERA